MSENSKNCPSQYPRTQGEVFKWHFMFDQQFIIIVNKNKIASIQIWEAEISIFAIFFLNRKYE